MATNGNVLVRLLGVAGLALALNAGTVMGQPDNQVAPDRPKADGGEGWLGGPRVRDREVPGVHEGFGASGRELGGKGFGERIPPRVFREALQPLLADDAADNVRATPEQREKIEGIQRDFEAQMKEYVSQHHEELQQMREKIPGGGPAGEILKRFEKGKAGDKRVPKGGLGEKGKGGPADIPPEAREQMKQLMDGMPKFEQAYTKVWDMLSPAQREVVQSRLDEYKGQMSERRQEAYVRQKVGKGQGEGGPKGSGLFGSAPKGSGGPNGPEGPRPGIEGRGKRPGPQSLGGPGPGARGEGAPRGGPRGEAVTDRRERLMRAFERMSPEQQEQVLRRLEGLGRGPEGQQPQPQPPARRRARGQGPGEAKPAPDMQELRMPHPDNDEQMAPPPPPAPEHP